MMTPMSQWRIAVADNPVPPDNRSTIVERHLSRSSEPVRAKAKHIFGAVPMYILSESSEPVRAKAKHIFGAVPMYKVLAIHKSDQVRSHSRCRVGKTIDLQLRTAPELQAPTSRDHQCLAVAKKG